MRIQSLIVAVLLVITSAVLIIHPAHQSDRGPLAADSTNKGGGTGGGNGNANGGGTGGGNGNANGGGTGGGNGNANGGGTGGSNGNANGGGTGGSNGNANGGGTGGGNGNANGGGTGGSNGNANGGGTGGGNGNSEGRHEGGSVPGVRGHGLSEHSGALHTVMRLYGMDAHSATRSYTYHPLRVRPESFSTDKEEIVWLENEHKVLCSMYRYLTRLRELHPNLKEGYIDWMAQQTAVTIGTDPVETKAALLGFPHDHSAHTDTVLKDISSEGCSTDAATKNGEQIAEEHSLHDASEKFERFTVNDQSTDAAIIFTVMESEVAFTDYGISHEKEMHLIVVRDDLRHFFHIHPERDANGIWSVPFTPSSGGTYRIYADFVDDEVHHHTLLFDRTYTGDHGIEGFIHNVDTQKSVGPFTVSFDDAPSEHGILLSFHVRDGNGNAPVFEPYLGTSAHGILLSPSGDFIHTHPSLANDTITLYVENPKDDLYRVFTQFQVQGKLYTTEFDWEPKTHGMNGMAH